MPKMQKMEAGPCAFLWERSYKGLELAQLLGQLGVFLTEGRQCWRRCTEIQGDFTDVGRLEVEQTGDKLTVHSSARRRTWSRSAAFGPVREKRRVVLHVPRSGDGCLAWPGAAVVTPATDWRR